jgi:hypothetical protein
VYTSREGYSKPHTIDELGLSLVMI